MSKRNDTYYILFIVYVKYVYDVIVCKIKVHLIKIKKKKMSEIDELNNFSKIWNNNI